MPRVLIATNDPELVPMLQAELAAQGCTVALATDPASARRLASNLPSAVLVLDLALPGLDGTAAVADIRARTAASLVVLCAGGAEAEVIAALDAGADDALARPFSPEHLLARLRATLRRGPLTAPARTAEIGPYTVDPDAHTIAPVHRSALPQPPPRLTPNEWRLLGMLLERPGQVVPSRDILRAVWGPGHEENTNYLRVYMATLRRKLEPDPAHPRHLLTTPGIGYRYQP